MSIELYLSFFLTSLLLIVSPGPVNILTMSLAIQRSWRHSMSSVWGATLALLIHLGLTALTLGSVMQLASWAFDGLRWVGAAYLVYLGVQLWRSRTQTLSTSPRVGFKGLFWRGFATSGMNPKTLLFFPSFFPQFMRADSDWPISWQFGILAATFVLLFIGGLWLTALASQRLQKVLESPKRAKTSNRVMGGLLVLMGAMLVGAR